MTRHELKTEPDVFEATWAGRKTAEYRRNDRNFGVGDQLILKEWSREGGYTGREVAAVISHVLEGPRFGVPTGYAMLSFTSRRTVDRGRERGRR